jgi:hypothetical protein
MNHITELMKATKEGWVASEPENPDLAIYLHFWRGDDLAVMVQCPLDPDIGMQAGLIGASGFSATTMSITFESYYSALKKSPLTGEPWLAREKQYVCEAVPENRTEHWVTECLTTSAHERDGEFALSFLPYAMENHQMIWSDNTLSISSAEVDITGSGEMFGYLQEVMSKPTVEELMTMEGESNKLYALVNTFIEDPEERLFQLDMATFRALEERQLMTTAMFAAEKGSRRAEWIKESFGAQILRVSDIKPPSG